MVQIQLHLLSLCSIDQDGINASSFSVGDLLCKRGSVRRHDSERLLQRQRLGFQRRLPLSPSFEKNAH